MNISNKEYDKMVKKASPNSPLLKDLICAFLVGGAICTLGEVLRNIFLKNGLTIDIAGSLVSTCLIFLSGLFTAIGIFDKIAKHAGAGTLVPITGFANAIVSPAIEYKPEGQIMGIGAKMFTIAGPVLVFGIGASAVYGLIFYIVGLFQ